MDDQQASAYADGLFVARPKADEHKNLRSPDTNRRYDLSYKVRYVSAVTEAAP
jgi:hypothetical protein